MKTFNLFGSTGLIGTKSLKVINDFFPKIKINLLVANKNYKALAKQAFIYKPKYICLIDKSKYKNLKKELKNNKVKVILSEELLYFLKENHSDLTILSISGYASLNYIQSIIINTNILGIVNKECIVAGGNLIKKLCLLHKTKLHALDSEHFSIQNFFDKKINIQQDSIKKIYLTASGGPFLGKNYIDIKSASIKLQTMAARVSLSPNRISSVATTSFSLIIGIALNFMIFCIVAFAFRYLSLSSKSWCVNKTCAVKILDF